MGKRPSFQNYPGDWYRDNVAGCSLAAQGLWLRMMYIGHDSERYGYLQINGKPIPDEAIARRCGASSVDEYLALVSELFAAGVPSRTPKGVIFSRRMVRDEHERQQDAERVRKCRKLKKNCNDRETLRNEEEEEEERALEVDVGSKPENSDEIVERIVRLHPSNWHLKDALQLPQAHCNAVIGAIQRDGVQAVESGTRAYAEVVSRWPLSEQHFVTRPDKFYGLEAHYLKDPAVWERSNGQQPSKTQQRVANNRAAIIEGLGFGKDAGSVGAGDGAGVDAGGNPSMVGDFQRSDPDNPRSGIPRLSENSQVLPKTR